MVSLEARALWTAQNPAQAREGYYMDGQGYIARMRRVRGKRISERQHRVVMERILGRPLRKGENVHHVNGCRWDNSPENLELWVTAQPAGQRPADLLAYAHAIIELYGNTPLAE